jgi:hypothetical protein
VLCLYRVCVTVTYHGHHESNSKPACCSQPYFQSAAFSVSCNRFLNKLCECVITMAETPRSVTLLDYGAGNVRSVRSDYSCSPNTLWSVHQPLCLA